MRKILLIFVILLISFVSGCEYNTSEIVESDILHEDAEVVDVVYVPSRHGSDISPTVTTDADGNLQVGITTVSVTIPEKYAVVFRCQHGKFIVEGTDQRHKDLWSKFTGGEKVDVSYKEVYKKYYHVVDKERSLIKTELIDYHFIDAVLK